MTLYEYLEKREQELDNQLEKIKEQDTINAAGIIVFNAQITELAIIKAALEDGEIQERKAGKWEDIHDREEWYGDQFKCSLCGYITLDNGSYCPNCGAEMRGAEND